MSVIAWILFGLAAGFLSSLIAKRRSEAIFRMGLGVCAAMVGGMVYLIVVHNGVPDSNPWSLVAAFTFAVLVLASYSVTRRVGRLRS